MRKRNIRRREMSGDDDGNAFIDTINYLYVRRNSVHTGLRTFFPDAAPLTIITAIYCGHMTSLSGILVGMASHTLAYYPVLIVGAALLWLIYAAVTHQFQEVLDLFLTLYPGVISERTVSTVNFAAGSIRACGDTAGKTYEASPVIPLFSFLINLS